MDVIDDQIDVTGRAFLGMTIACARCHDHKFDPIPTTDYYAMAGIFHSTETLAGRRSRARRRASDNAAARRWPTRRAAMRRICAGTSEEQQSAAGRDRARSKRRSTDLQNQQKQAGKKAPQPKGEKKGKAKPISPGRGREGRSASSSASRSRSSKTGWTSWKRSHAGRQSGDGGPRRRTPDELSRAGARRIEGQGAGSPARRADGAQDAARRHVNPSHSGRLELAHWIANKRQPAHRPRDGQSRLAALFGQGLVDSVDNFGALGDEPSHPELLDALAVQFMNEKWSVKKLIRSIVLSRIYQLSSEHNAENYAMDPGEQISVADGAAPAGRRGNPRRHAGRQRRSSISNVPRARRSWSCSNGQSAAARDCRKSASRRTSAASTCRSCAATSPKCCRCSTRPIPSLIVGKRDVTTVPTQALFLMNNPFVMKQSEEMAKRVLKPRRLGPGRAHRPGLSPGAGPPADRTTSNRDVAQYLTDYRKSLEAASHKGNPQLAAWTSFCQTLFASGEFRYVY